VDPDPQELKSRAATRPSSPATVFLAVVATWIVPGLGHWLLGRRGKGLLYFGLITFTFLFGMLLADFRNVRTDDDFQLYFLGEALYGGLAFPALWLTRGLELVRAQPRLDVGLLFSTVAGIMNVCVMVDVYETACPRPPPAEPAGASQGRVSA
jgi:hypothetical protein